MQKGQIPIIILVGLLVLAVVAGGVYLLGKQGPSNSSSSVELSAKPMYRSFSDTTKGIEISLPDNLIACEYGVSDLKLEQGTLCNPTNDSGDGSILIDTYNQFHHPMFDPAAPKTNQESLHDWVIKVANGISANNNEINKTASSEEGVPIFERSDNILDIDPNTVIDSVTDKLTVSNQVSYSYYTIIYQQQGDNIIVLSLGSNTKGENVEKLRSLLPLISTIPITTGDLRLNITWHHNKNSGGYAGFSGYLYQADQKTIAANIKADANGYYFVKLKPGTYYFFYPDGSSKQLQVELGVNNFVPFTKNNVIDIATEKDMFNGPVPNSPPQ